MVDRWIENEGEMCDRRRWLTDRLGQRSEGVSSYEKSVDDVKG